MPRPPASWGLLLSEPWCSQPWTDEARTREAGTARGQRLCPSCPRRSDPCLPLPFHTHISKGRGHLMGMPARSSPPSAPQPGRVPPGPRAHMLTPAHPAPASPHAGLRQPQPGDPLRPFPSGGQTRAHRAGCGPGGQEPRLSAAVPAPGGGRPSCALSALAASCLLFDPYPRSAPLPGAWAAGKKPASLSHAPDTF